MLILFTCTSCDYDFDIHNPSVKEFVALIKNGSYDMYEISNTGEKLWLIMPDFTEKDIPDLLKYASDLTHISDFPVNPVSSIPPYHLQDGSLILGECLLWTIEGIRKGNKYGSLTPILLKNASDDPSISSEYLNKDEILEVKAIYDQWWKDNKSGKWREIDPLESTIYSWR